MKRLGILGYVRQALFTPAKLERGVSRALRQAVRLRPIRQVVEIGVGNGERAEEVLRLIGRDETELRYTGIDLFESAGDRSHLTLKQAHQKLKPLAAKIQLIPGDPLAALHRCANSLAQTDLLLVDADVPAESMAQAWFFVPRMLAEHALVFVEKREGDTLSSDPLDLDQVVSLARQSSYSTPRAA